MEEKTIQDMVRNYKPNQSKPLPWWKETNALIWHVVHSLNGNSDHFKYTENYKEYMRSISNASLNTGVILIDYMVMPTHAHDIVMVPGFEALRSFLRRVDISYARKRLAMKGKDGLPITKAPVFDGLPYCTPMGTVRQTYETLRYQHNNPAKWNIKHPDNQVNIIEDSELYWKSSAYQRSRETNEFRFDGNHLLMMTGKTWPELLDLYSMDRKDFDREVKKIEDSMTQQDKDRFLKIDPSKPWSMDLSRLTVEDDD